MFSNKSNILMPLLVASMVAVAVATVELEVGKAREPVEFEFTMRKIHMGPSERSDLVKWLEGFRVAVNNYLTAVSAPDFSRSSLAWSRETKVLVDALGEQGNKMRDTNTFKQSTEVQESTAATIKFFQQALENYTEATKSEDDEVQFSAKEVNHYAFLLEQLFIEASDVRSLINIQSIKIHHQELGVIVAKYVKLLKKAGLDKAISGLTSGLEAI